jgi:hypothetical protein
MVSPCAKQDFMDHTLSDKRNYRALKGYPHSCFGPLIEADVGSEGN